MSRVPHVRHHVAVAAFAAAMVLSACLAEHRQEQSPGANERAGDIAIRNVHLESPPDGESYPAGADVHLYAWFKSEGADTALLEVSSPIASNVSMTQGQLPVALPANRLVALGSRDRHLVLENIDRELAGHELIPVELVFDNGEVTELRVQAVEVPDYE